MKTVDIGREQFNKLPSTLKKIKCDPKKIKSPFKSERLIAMEIFNDEVICRI